MTKRATTLRRKRAFAYACAVILTALTAVRANSVNGPFLLVAIVYLVLWAHNLTSQLEEVANER